ncbi:MAG TPA: NAD-dependent epimerase/dehydratase family protein [Kofleriaceae bacterium]|nr:NAD-dependent epimerase/dehydratase family protein [Kofleriaceae bacterium]
MNNANSSNANGNKPLHVIAGAGQIGPLVAERLIARGLRVRMIKRGAFGDAPVGVETLSANVSDPREAAEALRGASVVYHCANPRYNKWPEELVPLAKGITAGAAANGARLVALDNLYMYELAGDGRLAPDTKVAPVSKKGALRAEAAAAMLDADARGEAPVAIVRAADFFGPSCTRSIFGDRFWQKLFAGKAVETMGDVDQPHTYSYGPDVADALVTIGLADPTTDRDVYGRVWHAPALPAESTRTWINRFAQAAGVEPRFMRLSPLLLRLAGIFIREAGELPEMMYQWRAPFVLDDTAYRARFGAKPTPLEVAVPATLAWARAHYASASREAA